MFRKNPNFFADAKIFVEFNLWNASAMACFAQTETALVATVNATSG